MPLDIPIYNPNSRTMVADWVEISAAIDESEISKAEVGSAIEEWKGSEPDESFIGDVWTELERRQELYGASPPYLVESRVVVPNTSWEDIPEYLMCLILSIKGNRDEPAATGRLFERLSSVAIKNYLGGQAIIYGHPSRQDVRGIAEELCERFGFQHTSNFNDRGLDVIGWKTFGDQRPSQMVALFQCAAGHNWKSKLTDLPLAAWCKYIAWGCDPVKGFVLPQIVAREEFAECSYAGGMLIDRARIYRNTALVGVEPGLRRELRDWCNTRLPDLS